MPTAAEQVLNNGEIRLRLYELVSDMKDVLSQQSPLGASPAQFTATVYRKPTEERNTPQPATEVAEEYALDSPVRTTS
jgi:hypothetical protein